MLPSIEYTNHKIKKRKGSYRYIYAPNDDLKAFQNELLEHFYKTKPHSSCHGFVPGKSIVTNALPHVKKDYVLSMDIKNFFPKTTTSKVERIFTRWFTSHKQFLPYVLYKNHLPQGAPTSPYLANFALYDFDNTIKNKIKEFSGSYTRYADDITISWNGKINIKELLTFVNVELSKENYFLSKSKTKLMHKSRRQKVTGIIVNETLNIPYEVRNQLRAYNHLVSKQKFKPEDIPWVMGLNGYNLMTQGYNINQKSSDLI